MLKIFFYGCIVIIVVPNGDRDSESRFEWISGCIQIFAACAQVVKIGNSIAVLLFTAMATLKKISTSPLRESNLLIP